MNKVILLGRLTKDVELRYTQTSNTAVSSFSIAVNRRYTKEGEEQQTDFINIVAWGKLAETTSKYLRKGSPVLITGRLQIRTWEDEKNQKHYATEVVAEELYFIESKKEQEPDISILTGSTQSTIPTDNENMDETISGDDLPF
jgi:single-strand DNA-binding protein